MVGYMDIKLFVCKYKMAIMSDLRIFMAFISLFIKMHN